MAKKVAGLIKLQIPAGKANPAPPIGPALGQKGVNIMEFCKKFNAETQGKEGLLPTIITVYIDKSFSFITKQPPMSYLLKKAAKIQKGSANPNKVKVARITKKHVEEIAKAKMEDLNAVDLKGAVAIVEGSARSMGIEVT